MAGTTRFDCFPSDFLNGVIGLTADQIAVYTVVMMLQYDRGVFVAYRGREREIAVRSGMSIGRVRLAIEGLCGLSKLILHSDGSLEQPRTTTELARISQKISKNAENSAKGGNANREKWEQKRNDINETESRSAIRTDSQNIALLPSTPVPLLEDTSYPCPKSAKAVRTRHAYPEDFEEFWSAYPTDSNMPKSLALPEWKRLSEDERRDATASLPAFKRYCVSHPDYRPVHASRYLSQRRWEGHLKTVEAVSRRVFVHRDSPQWSAWEKHLRAHGRKVPPTDNRNGWEFDSEWPPRSNSCDHERLIA